MMNSLEKKFKLELFPLKQNSMNLKLFIVSILIISSLSKLGLANHQDKSDRNKSITKLTAGKQTDEPATKNFADYRSNEKLQHQLQQQQQQQHQQQQQNQAEDLDQSSSRASQPMEASSSSTLPSITSVHQVWTSASSGRLDELSPEIIGKLNSDVPFLAAYALRPRLVGGSNRAPSLGQSGQSQVDPQRLNNRVGQVATVGNTANGTTAAAALVLETGASSPRGSTESLVPKLGDFSEFRVVTSSTSRSEHHHERKTSLKRRSDDELRMKKRVLAEASQLIRKRRRRNNNKLALKNSRSHQAKKGKGSTSKSRAKNIKPRRGSPKKAVSSSRLKRKGAILRAGRLRTKLNRRNLQHHMNIIKHGRYQQQQQQEQSAVGGAKNLDSNGQREDFSGLGGGTKGGRDSGGVKGGSRMAAGKPFYSKAIPGMVTPDGKKMQPADDAAADDDDDDAADAEDGVKASTPNELEPETTGKKASGDAGSTEEKTLNEVDEDVELDKLPEPKRVGDGDVDEEEGDTVTVMPKFDGVDDDPEIPDDYEETTDQAGGPPSQAEAEADEAPSGSGQGGGPESDEPRTKRVNRERQNEPRDREPTSDDGGQDDDGGGGGSGTGSGSGGGIGATVGSGSVGSSNNSGNGATGVGGRDSDDDSTNPTGAGTGGEKVKPGVEFADSDRNDTSDDDGDGGQKKPASKSANTGGTSEGTEDGFRDDDHDDDDVPRRIDAPGREVNGIDKPTGEFDSKKEKSGGREIATGEPDGDRKNQDHVGQNDAAGNPEVGLKGPASKPSLEREPDVDYRDDTEESERKGSKSGHNDGESSKKDRKEHKSKEKDCDDGSYSHHDDEHHHHHHDSIKWLQDAIPGEPNLDYPILSQANITNFSCSDQKYPGYYADVEARCQVFHICQADGRQDSFLCPNGTIFSQKFYVCVWWNSFDCEDAPKYYDLNALLYKSSLSNRNNQGSSTVLRPLDGKRIGSSVPARAGDGAGFGGGTDEESSIDSLIRNMRRNKAGGSSRQPGDGPSETGPSNEEGSGVHYGGHSRRAMDNDSIGPDDEATIQRKSTNTEDEPAGFAGNSSRLRASDAEPRRKRRASVRQAPPKLKSRRVSRNSRRRKLRHGIKPKRRA